jgi:U3 small nucleolar RNA-associated protein 21
LQSGKDRGAFSSKLLPKTEPLNQLHSAEITGVGIDQLNKHAVSSSLDGTIKLWDFFRGELIKTYSVGSSIENLSYNRLNDLIAFNTSGLTLQVVNARSGLKKVREFKQAANNKITDICFSQPDSKWVLCSSLDKCIRVWDILTGSLVDWVQFQSAPISLDFSPSGEFLATSHVGSKALYLWSNRGHFESLIIQRVPDKPILIELPSLAQSETVKHSHKDFYGEADSSA